ncbi:DUF4030 domain-containing protein [Priestia koreensis]|uniref:DUF4030 domain-containing protein n=1 Tax=Priestia koreensis TaxID=284581 RepID=UPI001F57C4D0|nr:DUF4030 domain-containing protein [Priestia koreensis]UNL83764.1 DUF4030 domain-containing protein [Priestia koreensis]
MNEDLKDHVKLGLDQIDIPKDLLDQRIKAAIKRGRKEQHLFKTKWLYMSGVAVLLLSLLVSSAFISPSMAKVISYIPYLNQIIGPKQDIVTEISEALMEKGYETSGVGASMPEKILTVTVNGSENYFKKVKGAIEEDVSGILKRRGYDTYTLNVVKDNRSKQVFTADQLASNQAYQKISALLIKDLKKYRLRSFAINNDLSEMTIYIPTTETRISELKNSISSTLSRNHIKPMAIKVEKIDLAKRNRDRKWVKILNLVGDDLLGKKEYNVTTVGYSINPEPEIQAFIGLASTDQDAQLFAKQLKTVISYFLSSEKMKSRIGNDPYHITIYGKDNKIIY